MTPDKNDNSSFVSRTGDEIIFETTYYWTLLERDSTNNAPLTIEMVAMLACWIQSADYFYFMW